MFLSKIKTIMTLSLNFKLLDTSVDMILDMSVNLRMYNMFNIQAFNKKMNSIKF